jgi:hypothetical protein
VEEPGGALAGMMTEMHEIMQGIFGPADPQIRAINKSIRDIITI